MSASYVSVCRDGMRVVCPVGAGPRQIQFGTDAPIPLPSHGLYLVAATQQDGDHWAVMQAGEADEAYLVKRRSRSITTLPLAHGMDAVWVTPNGHVCRINALGRTWTRNGDTFDVPPAITSGDGTSQGFAWVDDDGTSHFRDHANLSPDHPDGRPLIHGRRALRHRTSGTWTWFGVGEDEGLYAYHAPSDTLYLVWSRYLPVMASGCAQADGSLILALNLAMDGQVFVPSSEFTQGPFPLTIPTFLPSRMGVGLFFDPEGPTICKADDARFPFISRERTPIVFCDLDKDNQAAAQRLGDLHQIPIGGYLDHHGYDPARLPRGWRAWIQCYPTGSVADTADAIQRDIAIVKYANRPFDLVVAMYCGYQSANRYTWTEQRVLDVLGAAYQLGNAQGAGALWGFARRRGEPVVDGTDFWLGLNEALRRIREASSSWRQFPQLPGTPSSPQPGPSTPSRWPSATPYGAQHMAVRGGLIGSGGFVGRVDPSEKKIHFDRMVAAGAHIGGHEEVEPRKLANGKWNLIYVAAQVGLNGAPKWECGTDLDRQFEVRPLDQLKGDEEWTGVVMPNGRIQFTVEHEANGQRFSSVPLTFVENK